ncbi:ABC transporter substrate-binding protein [Nocardia goodfellowii]|uniref:Iron complex transport system substrate-binding protein n=1 Tax=Nocardia goodfellowii TaxID=882446 RepID=A0ABS4QF47_9NOCA|nr:ABC transporter substrate-binding protein [Nocardia goodfellowii]MBP2189713.1 iron complex transport system substrate-binding protein [Nocardia goodfellowii]
MRAALALFVLALVAVVAGCGNSGTDAAETSGTREVQTDRGAIAVPAEPQRIAVVNGSLAGYLFDLGAKVKAADPRILGVPLAPGEFPAAWAADAKQQGTTVLPSGDNINLEFIAAQQPDLIIGGGQGFPGQQSIDAYDKLSAIAPTVLVPSNLTNWQDQLRAVANIVNKADKVDTMINAYTAKVAEVKAAIKVPAGTVSVFQSRKDNKPSVIAPGTPLAALLTEVGFTVDNKVEAKAGNPTRATAADWVSFSPELLTVVVDAPALFVVRLEGGRDLAQLKDDAMLATLPAFRSGQVYDLPATSQRPDYRNAMATLDLLAQRFK